MISRKFNTTYTKMNLPLGRAVASKFVVDGDVLLLTLLESLESLFVAGGDFDAAVAVDVQELVAQKLLQYQ